MKKDIEKHKTLTITIERVDDITEDNEKQERKTIFYLINGKTPYGSSTGFRANTLLNAWAKMMQEFHI